LKFQKKISGVGLLIIVILVAFDMVMCWYSFPELVFPLYIFPMLIAGCSTHATIAHLHKKLNAEMVHFDGVLLLFAILLAYSTYLGIASAFFLLIHAFFPLLRDPLIYLLGKMGLITRVTPRCLLFTQLLCTVPVMVFDAYAAMLLFDFFVPVTGRMGVSINPEYVMMPLSLFVALSFVLYTSNLFYVSRRMDYPMKCGSLLYCLFFLSLLTTRLGWPYKYSDESPRLRRLITLDTERSIYPFRSSSPVREHALFVQTLDYRGINDLPEHTFLTGNNEPNCSDTKDEYCRLPYYTAIHQMFPPRESRWIPLPNHPRITKPISVVNTEKLVLSKSEVRMNFTIFGGVDKMSLHLTPLSGFVVSSWSFTNFEPSTFGKRNTYFVFLTESRWIPLPNHPRITKPISAVNTEKLVLSKSEVRMNFTIFGGVDKMSLHLTPLSGFLVSSWSFTNFEPSTFGKRNTYFVFLTYGAEAPEHRAFWIILRKINSDGINEEDLDETPLLEISVATHYAHGPHQYSETLSQLRSLITSRRKTPHLAVGWWKWAITTIAGVAEIVMNSDGVNEGDLDETPLLEISVATHYAHGPHQYSETLSQLRSLITSRRKTPHLAVGK
uniref:Transmembrane protein n=1 Tax=Gongylonema pulchrum TaxID=637853 RepID=A0A183DQ78_9BILA